MPAHPSGHIYWSFQSMQRRWRMPRAWLALIALGSTSCFAGTASLSWDAVHTNLDGTPVQQPVTYRPYWQCGAETGYPQTAEPVAQTALLLDSLPDSGSCSFVVVAIDGAGRVSGFSNQATKLFGGGGGLQAPGSPDIAVSWKEATRMAYPSVISITQTNLAAASAHTANFPSSGIADGDLAVIVGAMDGSGDRFTSLEDVLGVLDNAWYYDAATSTYNHGSGGYFASWTAVDAADNGTTFDFSATSGEAVSVFVILIRGWDGVTAPAISGTPGTHGSSTSIDAPSVNGWNGEQWLAIWTAAWDEQASNSITAFPTSFSDNQIAANSSGTGANPMLAVATSNQSGASVDPATATLGPTSRSFATWTIAVRGTTSGGTDMAASGSLSIAGAADLDARGTLVAAGALSIAGVADLDARGSIAAAGALSITGVADLDAQGNLTTAGALSISGAATLADAGGIDLGAAGLLSITGAADLDSSGRLTAAGALAITGAADLDAVGRLTAAGLLNITGAADLDAAGRITTTGSLTIVGAADLDAIGRLAAVGPISITGLAVVTAADTPDMAASGVLTIVGFADLDAVGVLSAAGLLEITGTAVLVDGNSLPDVVASAWFAMRARRTVFTAARDDGRFSATRHAGLYLVRRDKEGSK